MGAFLDKPNTEIHNSYHEHEKLRIAYSCMQGWRTEMEDAHSISLNLPDELKTWTFFAVFDGHAGNVASDECSKNLLNHILKTEEFLELRKDKQKHTDRALISAGIKKGFINFDEKLYELKDKSGSTAIVSFVTPDLIILGNCGDSRAMIVSHDFPHLFSNDHKPNDANEKKRIQDAGSQILMSRVNGALAVSRSLGDFEYKRKDGLNPDQQAVSPEPDVYYHERQPETDQFLVLACDGIWDVYSNYHLSQFLLHRLKCVEDLNVITSEVLYTCLSKGSKDNMSVMLIALEGAPKCDPVMKKADKDLDNQLKTHVSNLATNTTETTSFQEIYSKIEEMNLNNYPPGGAIAKRHIMEAKFNSIIPQE